MVHSLLFILATLCLFHNTLSASLPKVYKHGCVILANQKIYCHGGATRTAPTMFANSTYFNDSELYNQLVYLDVSRPLNLSSANTQWQPVPPPTQAFNLEPRADFAMVAMNDTAFVISGGIGPSTTPGDQSLTKIAMRYDAGLNLWTDIKNHNTSAPKLNFTFDTQLFGGRGVKISDREFMINGGIPPNNNTILPTNTSYVDVEEVGAGWSSLQAWTIPITRGGELFPERSRVFRACADLAPDGVVYFFGGSLPANATNNFNYQDNMGYYSFDNLLAFYPAKNQTFNVVKAGSSNNPTLRQLHTANAIPNTNKILIYGGVSDEGASLDFGWIFDITTRMWTTANFTNGDDGPGRRFGHQSILVGKELLYIIGGVDSNGMTQNDVNILNVTSMTWLKGSYTNTYDQQNADASNTGDHGNGASSLSGGAIAGIVIGCVAAMAIIAAAIIIMRMQRKKKALLASGSAPAGFNAALPPMMATTGTKEYNTASPFSDGTTTVYDHDSVSKPHKY